MPFHGGSFWRTSVSTLVAFAFLGLTPLAGHAETPSPGDSSSRGVELEGCLEPTTVRGEWRIEVTKEIRGATKPGTPDIRRLVGNVPEGYEYWTRPVRVLAEEERNSKSLANDEEPKFRVIKFTSMPAPLAKVDQGFLHKAHWRRRKVGDSGVAVELPETMKESGVNPGFGAAFADLPPSVLLASYEIPLYVFSQSNFLLGVFAIYANTTLGNRERCEQFYGEKSDPEMNAQFSIRGIEGHRFRQYLVGWARMNQSHDFHILHTFQNGMCYEFQFEFVSLALGLVDFGCAVSVIKENDEERVRDLILSTIEFRAQ